MPVSTAATLPRAPSAPAAQPTSKNLQRKEVMWHTPHSISSIPLYFPNFINRNILMSKLLHNGVRGVMQHCLSRIFVTGSNTSQSKNCNSSMSNITLGGPQCSVLGPVLFLLYINDMYRSSNQMCFVHFADDTTVFSSNSDINNVHVTVNRELVG